jgi:lipid-A-disaccharide synthase
MPRVFITAAEVSGDKHAANFAVALRELMPDIMLEAFGGPALQQAGALIHHDTVTRAAMSWMAVFRAFEFKRLLKRLDRMYRENPPDLHVCVDSSGVNLHFAKIARSHNVPVLYYVAPQLWASRPGRMPKVRERVNRLACIWQFEEEYFGRAGVPATYVGHPLFDQLPRDRVIEVANKYPNRPPIVGLLPGSRKSDATHNFSRMIEVAVAIQNAYPEVTFHIPTTPATDEVVRAQAGVLKRAVIQLNGTDALLPECDIALAKSGTSTLHVAAYGVPMVVVYYGNEWLWKCAGQFIVKTRTFSTVNILAKRHIVKEFVPWYGPVTETTDLMLDYLKHPEKLLMQRNELIEMLKPIDHPGASKNVAKLAVDLLAKRD